MNRSYLRCCWLGLLLLAFALRAQAQAQIPLKPATGLRGTYYAGENFERRVLTRTDPAIDFNWDFDAPGPGLPPESFSVRWTGWLLAPETGTYTFHLTVDDGMRVWIGGRQVLNEWRYQPTMSASAPMRLTAGRYYSVRVEYFQGSRHTRAFLGWTRPSAPKAAPEAIAARHFTVALPTTATPLGPPKSTPPASGGTVGIVAGPPASRAEATTRTPVKPSAGVAVAGKLPAGIGLRATYYAGSVRGPAVHSRVEPVLSATWQGAPPAPGVPGQGFSVRYTGYVRAPETGVYVLHTEWDDAHDVRLAGEDILSMEKYEPEFFGPNNGVIPVDVAQYYEAGKLYAVDVAYKNVRGRVSRAVLSWARPAELGRPTTLEQAFAAAKGRRLTVVPQQLLYPELPRPLPEPPVAAAQPVRPSRLALPPKPAVAARTPRPAPPARLQPAARPRPVVTGPRPAPVVPDTMLPDLSALSRGAAVTLPNLYFTQSTASLLPASRPVLDALARTLTAQPQLRLEIAGHTDNVGEPRLNLRLSEQRARVVRRYLIGQGIDSVRLTARGYGGTRPVADNRDPQQRPRNRRVEVVVQ
ncbi:PA14 domain-containing protein [Hymenobacter weizhouensis]|uniref:PA14 domain-containing protein n=1 Tax=Hymenobacter sp. YIM 151500-1 TaxID=2987689 RepID=UPI0022269311|nr:PA14 domain-containing protein [Hymenobacter sp. YIM 151500-1]UYZ62450.1 PA14 domain-containing protein [Hymenobacter sp. YIM 151500-1]